MTIPYEPEISTAGHYEPEISTAGHYEITASHYEFKNLSIFFSFVLKIYLWRSPERKHTFHCY
jgi:hypothetical protein